MSERACYIQRTDRGVQIRSATLIGPRTSERWDAPPSSDAGSARHAVFETADWIRERLGETRSAKRLDTLCLDVDGAVCSWVKGQDAEADLIRSAIDGAGVVSDDEFGSDHPAPGVADRLPQLGRELDLDVLGDQQAGERVAVLAAPDAPGRLLLDRLDARGVRVSRVITLWHAIAQAWDPGARADRRDQAGLISSDHPPAAVVLIEPDAGRLVWSWSKRGELLACGSMRLRRARDEHSTGGAEVLSHDIARLAGDWLGWSAQIGVCPSRVVVVGDPAPSGMSRGEIGTALTRAWPSAVADLVPAEDPVAETLSRTLDARPLGSFTPLTERPTRSHRSAYRWVSAALLLAAACVGALAWSLFARAGSTRDTLTSLTNERTEALNAIDPALVMDPFASQRLEERIGLIRQRSSALEVDTPRPIMQELDTISLVLAMPGVSVDLIEVLDTLVTIKVRVKDLESGEQLNQALRSIGGSDLRWRDPGFNSRRNDEIEVTYTALWPERARSGNGGTP